MSEVFTKLDTGAAVRDEVHPLSALLSKQHFSTVQCQVLVDLPRCVTTALNKDLAPLTQVCGYSNMYM